MFSLYLCICLISFIFIYDKINKMDETKIKGAMMIYKVQNCRPDEFKQIMIIAMIIVTPILPILIIIAYFNKNK